MNPVAKFLIIAGIMLVAAGLFWQLFAKHLPLGRLPGDIVIEKENFKFYFPIVTGILLSIILTLIIWIIQLIWRWKRRRCRRCGIVFGSLDAPKNESGIRNLKFVDSGAVG